jgi:hypothetical protein
MVAVIGIATGAEPQLNVMMPPALTAALRAVNALALVQLAAVPLPIVAVGVETSTGWPPAGIPVEQVRLETGPPSGALPGEPLLPPLEEPLLLLDEPEPPPLEEPEPLLDEPPAPDELPDPLLAPEEPEELEAPLGPASAPAP